MQFELNESSKFSYFFKSIKLRKRHITETLYCRNLVNESTLLVKRYKLNHIICVLWQRRRSSNARTTGLWSIKDTGGVQIRMWLFPSYQHFICWWQMLCFLTCWLPCLGNVQFFQNLSQIYQIISERSYATLFIFSYTFDKFIEKTDKIWKHQRFFIIEEYYSRPIFVVPFSFIPFIFSFFFQKNVKTDNAFGKYIGSLFVCTLVVC